MTTKAEKADMVSLLADAFVANRLQPGEFTTRMFMEKIVAKGGSVTHVQATRQLTLSVVGGELVVREVIHNGRRCKAYRKK